MPAHRSGEVPDPHASSPSRRAVVAGLLALGAAPLLPKGSAAAALPKARRLVILLTAEGIPVAAHRPTFKIWDLCLHDIRLQSVLNGTWEVQHPTAVNGAALFDTDTWERLTDFTLSPRILMPGDVFSASFFPDPDLLERPDPDLRVAAMQDPELPSGPA